LFYQKTIKDRITLEGVGLHTGKHVRMVMCPAPAGTGVVFRVDGKTIKASYENVAETSYATTLKSGTVRVRTVEHLLGALSGLSIDNVYVDMDAEEVPVMDGSARPFVKAIRAAGIVSQNTLRRYIKIVKAITVHEGDKSATLLPSSVPRITYRIDFAHPLISDQSLSMDLDVEGFERELAAARTFGFLKDADMLRKAGLALGCSLENAVVIDGNRILNEEGLRYKDEFVRHKMLDAVGDVALLGMPFIAHLVADKSGHALNQRLVREAIARPECWLSVEGEPELVEAGLAPGIYDMQDVLVTK
jgi:UDP-3-O-[3-hydroxymyristoyl] N-acetylglucosamine deacetylase